MNRGLVAMGLMVAVVTGASVRAEGEVSFRNQVQPILTKAGCNSGACHGAAAGKNGFKLSLRGYDDEGDWRTITRHAMGRRLNPADPARSLLLLKPTLAVSHKGGERIKVSSPEYKILVDWIAQGAPAPKADDARIDHIELLPKQVILKPGEERRLQVLAYFSDGRREDVTRWAKYTANDTTVAVVNDEDGKVKVMGFGEGAITAWYLSRITTATITVPYGNKVPAETFAGAARRNFIDELVLEKLKALNLPPSPRSDDAEFLRRAYVDTIGVLPTAGEAKAFLEDRSADKRDRLVESLLGRGEFVDYWAYKWSDLLLVNGGTTRFKSVPAGVRPYYNWIRRQVAANTPWDRFVRQIVTAKGDVAQNGAATFFVLHDDPTKMAETVSVAFMGMSVNCAKCHNHPMEKWTNNQYYAFANLFARVRMKVSPVDGNPVVFCATSGDLVQPLTGRPQAPTPLDGKAMAMEWAGDRREALADWLVGRENPYFARSITNRVWANFMGVGLVEAVDDMRKTNPASNPVLLDRLADYLADQRFDLKALMRVILQSEAYQRTSEPVAGNEADRRFYSRYYPKRLMAEVALDALSQVSGQPTMFAGFPAGTRAMQLPDTSIDSYFLKSFGRPERVLTCECERTTAPSMAQALHIANGETLNSKLQAKGNRIDQLLGAKAGDEEIVEDVYLSALSRRPTAGEKKQLLAVLGEAKEPAEKRQALEDLYWGILSSKAFLFNH